MRRPSLLTAVEAIALLAWVGLAASMMSSSGQQGELIPIDPKALASGPASESWMGVYYEGQKMGYTVSSRSPTADGGELLRSRANLRLVAMGQLNQVFLASNAVVDGTGALQQFDLFYEGPPTRLSARGEVQGDGAGGSKVVAELLQAGEVQRLEFDVEAPPHTGPSLEAWIRTLPEIHVGDRYELPYFELQFMTQGTMELAVVDMEILDGAEEAYWIERTFSGATSRFLITPDGRVLREEGAAGMVMVRETPEQARAMPDGLEVTDIISLSAVKLEGRLSDARSLRVLSLDIQGVEPERVRHDPPLQAVAGSVVTVSVPILEELPQAMPRVADDAEVADQLLATLFLPVDHRDIQEQADKIVGDIPTRRAAAKALVDWVYNYLDKVPTVSVPNALEVLQVGQGDCNEHTSLYVALARASGIPARIAAGLVYSDQVEASRGDGSRGAFYYHAWPEVWFGPELGWVPVDPTFGQFPADATHIKLVEGDLDKQIEIMGVMGRLGFKLVEAR